MSVHNFDPGLGIEDVVREELRSLLPARYSVRAGTVVDRLGHTAGDVDLVVFNDIWFPSVKAGATPDSRRVYLPVDGAYAVGEIKQTLTTASLDQAMEKLVVCHRLHRPETCMERLVENREQGHCTHALTNPLYSFVIATELGPKEVFVEIVERFIDICRSLKRLETPRALCVLGHGTLIWGYGYRDEQRVEYRPALFMRDDLYESIIPVMFEIPDSESALYPLVENLFLHLYHSVLRPEDVAPSYGVAVPKLKMPSSPKYFIPPDPDWIERLKVSCKAGHTLGGHFEAV